MKGGLVEGLRVEREGIGHGFHVEKTGACIRFREWWVGPRERRKDWDELRLGGRVGQKGGRSVQF